MIIGFIILISFFITVYNTSNKISIINTQLLQSLSNNDNDVEDSPCFNIMQSWMAIKLSALWQ